VADARASDTKIVALCPFAASVFRRHAELRDVLSG
jgi:predicted GNAT family acetyltransferase